MNSSTHLKNQLNDNPVSECGIEIEIEKLNYTNDCERVTCKRCLKRIKKFDDGWNIRVTFTTSCSGCFEGGDYMGMAHHYPYDNKARCHVGAGCEECGYKGKRRNEMWVPLSGEFNV